MKNFNRLGVLACFLTLVLAGPAALADTVVSPATGPKSGGNVVLISGLDIACSYGYFSSKFFLSLEEEQECPLEEGESAAWAHQTEDGCVITLIAPPHEVAEPVDILLCSWDTPLRISNQYAVTDDAAVASTSAVNDFVTETIVFTDSVGVMTLLIPPRSFGSGGLLQHTSPVTGTGQAPDGMAFAGDAFSLDTFVDGEKMDGFPFNNPITATVTYSASAVIDNKINEDTLELRFQHGGAWSSDGITIPGRSSGSNVITATLSHLSTFALMGETSGTTGQTGSTGSTGGGSGGSSGCFVSTLF